MAVIFWNDIIVTSAAPPPGPQNFFQTLTSTEVSVLTITDIEAYLRTLSVVESSILSLSRVVAYLRTISVIESSILTLDKFTNFLRALVGTELSVMSMSSVVTEANDPDTIRNKRCWINKRSLMLH